MGILKRIKLLFIDSQLVDFTLSMNEMYPLVKEKQKNSIEDKFDNIEKTITIMHTRGLKEGFINDYQKQRTSDVALKLMLITYKS